jgi:hypothetical protein
MNWGGDGLQGEKRLLSSAKESRKRRQTWVIGRRRHKSAAASHSGSGIGPLFVLFARQDSNCCSTDSSVKLSSMLGSFIGHPPL